MHMMLQQGRNMSYKIEQHFVSGQGLDLHLKNFQNDFAKNKMAP